MERVLTIAHHAGTCILDSQALEMWEIDLCCVSLQASFMAA